ncbi:MAG: hypothetical protein QXT84_02755 [Candidatus Bathyarchaeia archaeon]
MPLTASGVTGVVEDVMTGIGRGTGKMIFFFGIFIIMLFVIGFMMAAAGEGVMSSLSGLFGGQSAADIVHNRFETVHGSLAESAKELLKAPATIAYALIDMITGGKHSAMAITPTIYTIGGALII